MGTSSPTALDLRSADDHAHWHAHGSLACPGTVKAWERPRARPRGSWTVGSWDVRREPWERRPRSRLIPARRTITRTRTRTGFFESRVAVLRSRSRARGSWDVGSWNVPGFRTSANGTTIHEPRPTSTGTSTVPRDTRNLVRVRIVLSRAVIRPDRGRRREHARSQLSTLNPQLYSSIAIAIPIATPIPIPMPIPTSCGCCRRTPQLHKRCIERTLRPTAKKRVARPRWSSYPSGLTPGYKQHGQIDSRAGARQTEPDRR